MIDHWDDGYHDGIIVCIVLGLFVLLTSATVALLLCDQDSALFTGGSAFGLLWVWWTFKDQGGRPKRPKTCREK